MVQPPQLRMPIKTIWAQRLWNTTKPNREMGSQPTTMQEVSSPVGHEREAWRLAMQAEVDNLRDNETSSVACPAERRNLNPRNLLPMNWPRARRGAPPARQKQRKARAVICGNFQEKSANEELHTARADITSARAVLAASVSRKFDANGVIDIKAALCNAKLPG